MRHYIHRLLCLSGSGKRLCTWAAFLAQKGCQCLIQNILKGDTWWGRFAWHAQGLTFDLQFCQSSNKTKYLSKYSENSHSNILFCKSISRELERWEDLPRANKEAQNTMTLGSQNHTPLRLRVQVYSYNLFSNYSHSYPERKDLSSCDPPFQVFIS